MTSGAYFEYRNVDADFYSEYRLPRYLHDILPEKHAEILDIGCGLGQTMRVLRNEGYTKVTGIEPCEAAVKTCRELGLSVIHTTVGEFLRQPGCPRFDLVMMSHVLEHLDKDEIVPVLTGIRQRLVKPRAALVVMVPNAQSNTGCYWAYEDFTHTTLFTAGSLLYVLRAAGFDEVQFLDPEGLSGARAWARPIRRLLLWWYGKRIDFWNIVTGSSYHRPSPRIYTWELRAMARGRKSSSVSE